MLAILKKISRLIFNCWKSEFVKYVLAGGVAFVFDFSITILLYEFLHIHYLVAAGIGIILGMMVSYLLSIKWVFTHRSISDKQIELGVFSLIGIIGFLFHEYLMWFFVENILISVPGSKIIATIIVFIWNYTVRKFFLFREK